jgi:EmrB/QacA subfamily drug resistance transporter
MTSTLPSRVARRPGHVGDPPADDVVPGRTPARASIVLAAACLCQLMVVLDVSVVNVAIPDIGEALSFTRASLSWVVSAYTLAFGGLLLLGGRLADVLGHRRTMLGALGLFGFASLLGGLAQDPGQLIAARGAQGVAAAVLSPVTLTVLMLSFPEGPERRRAVATWGMVATAGGALGVLLSGLLTEYLDWRWVLLVNVPLVVAAAAFVFAALHHTDAPQGVRLDVPGAILGTTSMTLLAYGCVHAGGYGWGDDVTVAALGTAILAGAGFILRERRAAAPLVRLSLLRSRPVWTAVVIMALIGATAVAGFYFLSLFLQNVLGYDPLSTGLAFLPFCGAMAAATIASPRLVQRFGVRGVLTVGLTVSAVGMLGFARLDVGAGYSSFLLASIPVSIGLGACISPTLALGTSGVVQREAGMVSGLLNASRQTGGSLALAVLTTVATGSSVHAGHGPHALAHGYRMAFLVSSALLLAAATIARSRVPREPGPAPGRARHGSRARRLTLVGLSLALLAGGAYAALAGSDGRYVGLGAHGSYRTDRYGLATAVTNWRTAALGWAGSVRLEVASERRQPIFVGVATPAAVERYLSGTAYTAIVARPGGGVTRTEHAGTAPAPPVGPRWTAHAMGTGTQTLRWNADRGRQIAFAMNADRSRSVKVRVVSSAVTLGRMPWWIPTGLLALGAIAMAVAVAGLRRPTRAR